MTNSIFSFHKYYVLGVICDIFYFLYVLVRLFVLPVFGRHFACLLPAQNA